MAGRRVLVAGVSTPLGGRLAQALERDPEVEVIVGASPDDPTCELERTEFVRVGTQPGLLERVVRGVEVDTVVDARWIADSGAAPARVVHEVDAVGTGNLLIACGGADSPVRKLVVLGSAHVYGAERDDPAFFDEGMSRPYAPRTPVERDVVEADAAVRAFAERTPGVTVTLLRAADVLGPAVDTSFARLLALPVVPGILGFDPRWQVVHADDVVEVLERAVREDLPGVFNVAADGVLVLSEIAGLLGKAFAPVLSPVATGLAAAPLRRLGLRLPPELLGQLRYGRGLDNRRLKAHGHRLRHTSRETVLAYAEELRLRPLRPRSGEPYRYEREVEEFLRWSPSVRRSAGAPSRR